MKAMVLEGPRSIALDSIPDPSPDADDIIIRVGACGVCGTDLALIDGKLPIAKYPVVPGHELAGEVVTVGTNVRDLREGDRVAIDPSLACDTCRWCRRTRPNLCERFGALGGTHDGGFAEYVRVPRRNAHLLPSDVTDRAAALIEPLACVVNGVRRLAPDVGDRLLVIGAGTIGLMMLNLCILRGAADITVVDVNTTRLSRASADGASTVHTTVEAAATDHGRFDCVVDATGNPQAIQQGLDAVAPGGKLLLFGVAPTTATLEVSPYRVYHHEITILGATSPAGCFPRALDLVASGRVDTAPLVSDSFTLDDFSSAVAQLRRGEGLKVQIAPHR